MEQHKDTSQQGSENSRAEIEAEEKLTEIRRRAISNMEEKGLETLSLALGMATWHATDRGRDLEVPLLKESLYHRGIRYGSDIWIFHLEGDKW